MDELTVWHCLGTYVPAWSNPSTGVMFVLYNPKKTLQMKQSIRNSKIKLNKYRLTPVAFLPGGNNLWIRFCLTDSIPAAFKMDNWRFSVRCLCRFLMVSSWFGVCKSGLSAVLTSGLGGDKGWTSVDIWTVLWWCSKPWRLFWRCLLFGFTPGVWYYVGGVGCSLLLPGQWNRGGVSMSMSKANHSVQLDNGHTTTE